jgi:hypothetical protein
VRRIVNIITRESTDLNILVSSQISPGPGYRRWSCENMILIKLLKRSSTNNQTTGTGSKAIS